MIWSTFVMHSKTHMLKHPNFICLLSKLIDEITWWIWWNMTYELCSMVFIRRNLRRNLPVFCTLFLQWVTCKRVRVSIHHSVRPAFVRHTFFPICKMCLSSPHLRIISLLSILFCRLQFDCKQRKMNFRCHTISSIYFWLICRVIYAGVVCPLKMQMQAGYLEPIVHIR